jgi:hypothetical protein
MPISVNTGSGVSSTGSLRGGNLVGSINSKPIINAIAIQNSRKGQKAVKPKTNKKIKGKKKAAKLMAEQNKLTRTDSKSTLSSKVINDANNGQNGISHLKQQSGLSFDLQDLTIDGSVSLTDGFENINHPLDQNQISKMKKTPNWVMIDEDQVDDWSLIDGEGSVF